MNVREIESAILNSATEVVSFDVFDTLLVRPVIDPPDLFYIVERRVREAIGDHRYPFAHIRVWAEKRARQQLRLQRPDFEDITLDEIYGVLESDLRLSADDIDLMKQLEIAVELQYLRPRQGIKDLYALAVDNNKLIITISDVYLPACHVVDVLTRNGFHHIHRHFISSEIRLSKRTGNLFHYVLAELEIKPAGLVHIGDNKGADVERPKKYGIQAFHFEKPVARFFSETVHSRLWKHGIQRTDSSYRLMLGLIINNMFDATSSHDWERESLFNGDPYVLGYYGAGPVLFALTKWLMESSIRGGYEKLVFIARDGYIPLEIFKILRPLYETLPQTDYLRISRSACYPFDFISEADIIANWKNLPLSRKISVRDFLQLRFYLNMSQELEDFFRAEGIDVDRPFKNTEDLLTLCLQIKDKILAQVTYMRGLARRYYQDQIATNKKQAIFDLGYRGRAQRVINQIADRPVTGFYFFSYQDILDHDATNLHYFNFLTNPQNQYVEGLRFNTAILELLVSEIDVGSLVGFQEKDHEVLPVFEEEEIPTVFRQKIEAMQRGILDFCRHLMAIFGNDLRYLNVAPTTAYHVLSEFMTNPVACDAKIFDGMWVSNGRIGGRSFVISERDEESFWKAGYQALHGPNSPKEPLEGTSTSLSTQMMRGEDGNIRRMSAQAKVDRIWNLPASQFPESATTYWDIAAHAVRWPQPLDILEIGVFRGGLLKSLLERSDIQIWRYTGVDPYLVKGHDPCTGVYGKNEDEVNAIWENAKTLFDQAGHQLFRSCSHEFYAVRQESFWDIIIVNGDHRFAGALWDLQHWFKRLKPGGLFFTDDYGNSDTPEVTPAVNRFIQLNQENISRSGYRLVPFQNEGKEVPISLTIVYFLKSQNPKETQSWPYPYLDQAQNPS